MPAKKGEKRALGRGAVQLKKRPAPKYYQIAAARFREEDPIGREFKAWLAEEGLSMREFISRWMQYNVYVRSNIIHQFGE